MSSADASRPHDITSLVSWHARLMVLGWGICVPTGIVIARYLKVTPIQNWPDVLDNKLWWRCHLILQVSAVVLVCCGLGLILLQTGQQQDLHRTLGWLVTLGLAVQTLSGLMRGSKGGPTAPAPDGSWDGDHYLMTFRRRVFERVHKTLGYVLLALAVVTIFLGLWQVNAPRWMFLALPVFWTILIVVVRLVVRDVPRTTTYQAIWGPDPSLPGNRSPDRR